MNLEVRLTLKAYDVYQDLIGDTRKNGGATHWFHQERISGYVVGNNNTCLVTTGEPKFLEFLDQFILAFQNGADGIGMWIDEGKWYTDRVNHVEEIREAVLLGNSRNEIAIFDIKAQECYTL